MLNVTPSTPTYILIRNKNKKKKMKTEKKDRQEKILFFLCLIGNTEI